MNTFGEEIERLVRKDLEESLKKQHALLDRHTVDDLVIFQTELLARTMYKMMKEEE